jgi:serine/threonine protein kinase
MRATPIGGLPEAAALFYAGCLVLALKHVHGRKVAHRDVRPERILLDGRGYPKLFDFTRGKKVCYTRDG